MTFLRDTYPEEIGGKPLPRCAFEVLSSGGLNAQPSEESTRVGLYLYQISISEHQRPHTTARLPEAGRLSLGVDLHYLLTAWGATPQEEQIPLAWSITQLHQTPIFDLSILSPEAQWDQDEIVQLVPAAISVEELMRIWDSLNQTYRPSMAYVARGVRLGSGSDDGGPPVVARRFSYGQHLEDKT